MDHRVVSRPMVTSALLAPVIDGPVQPLHVVQRSRLALSLADATGRVVLGLTFPGAVRLPHSCCLGSTVVVPPRVRVGDGALGWVGGAGDPEPAGSAAPEGRQIEYRVSRWWRPARPRPGAHMSLAAAVDHDAVQHLTAHWRANLGRGPGLTPYGDDVLCGALITLSALAHPAFRTLAGVVAATDLESCTTATSASLLRAACQGWCIDELANHLGVLAGCDDARSSRRRLLEVGSSSGRGLLEGVALVVPGPAAR